MINRLISTAKLSTRQIDLKVSNQLATVEINNPSKRNALSKQLMIEFNQIIDQLNTSSTINCVILRSANPGMFCAGADLKERVGYTNHQVEVTVQGLRNTFQRWYNLPMPTIALLDGSALGGGLELALSSDLRVATQNVILGLPETSLAIVPGAGGTQRLSRIIGIAKAKELIFTSRKFSGKEAFELGLVNYLEADFDTAVKRCQTLADEILQNGPIGVRSAKKAINKGFESDLDTGLAIEEYLYHHVCESKDRLEGLKAFSEKRKPVYKGE